MNNNNNKIIKSKTLNQVTFLILSKDNTKSKKQLNKKSYKMKSRIILKKVLTAKKSKNLKKPK